MFNDSGEKKNRRAGGELDNQRKRAKNEMATPFWIEVAQGCDRYETVGLILEVPVELRDGLGAKVEGTSGKNTIVEDMLKRGVALENRF